MCWISSICGAGASGQSFCSRCDAAGRRDHCRGCIPAWVMAPAACIRPEISGELIAAAACEQLRPLPLAIVKTLAPAKWLLSEEHLQVRVGKGRFEARPEQH